MVQSEEGYSPEDAAHLRQSTSSMSAEDEQMLMRRLWKSDELIKQLKHIVKAQHNKIEELRERLDFEPLGSVRSLMANQDLSNVSKLKEDNDDLRRNVGRFKGEVEKLKRENSTLRKANNRLKRMLQVDPYQKQHLLPHAQVQQNSIDECVDTDDVHSVLSDTDLLGSTIDASEAVADTTASLHSVPAIPTELFFARTTGHTTPPPLPAVGSSTSSRALAKTSRPATSDRNDRPQVLPGFSKLWRLSSVVPMFWRSLESPASVLNTLIDVAGRLLGDGPSPTIVVYMLDTWLRATTVPSDGQPTLFHMGAGKTTVQVFHKDGIRPEPPQFSDLQALPTRSPTVFAIPIQTPTSHTKLAVLQIVSSEEHHQQQQRNPRPTPKVLKSAIGNRDIAEKKEVRSGFTDAQMMTLQLVCNVAGGILEQLKVFQQKERLLDRMRDCVEVAVSINQAKSLPDFEQRVKHLLGDFFQVTSVRVLFYDEESQELLISSAQMKRKGVSKVRLDKGVVGICAKRQLQSPPPPNMGVVHVSNISHHPYMDSAADGLQRSGRPISADAAMLLGPLVVEQPEGVRLVGVVQLLERKKKHTHGATDQGLDGFSYEEQNLFQQILRICGHVAWRTYKVQDLAAQVNGGQPVGLAHLLAG
jgi:GAF domain-containing protein